MSLCSLYQQFRAAPCVSFLADDASVTYLSSGLRITGQQQIVEHLAAAQFEVVCREAVVAQHECDSSIVLEIDAHITFTAGSGPFLPATATGLLSKRSARLLVVHTVMFDDMKRILSVRVFWDQAALLDQICPERHKWLIVSGREQITLARQCAQRPVPRLASGSPSRTEPRPVHIYENSMSASEDTVSLHTAHVPRSRTTPSSRQPLRTLADVVSGTGMNVPLARSS